LSIGSLMFASSYMIAKTDRVYEGHLLGAGSAGVMALAMGQRYLSASGGGKFMPAGLVAVLGVTACAYNAAKAAEWAPSSSSSKTEW
jgi:Transmembrane proteins 14C